MELHTALFQDEIPPRAKELCSPVYHIHDETPGRVNTRITTASRDTHVFFSGRPSLLPQLVVVVVVVVGPLNRCMQGPT